MKVASRQGDFENNYTFGDRLPLSRVRGYIKKSNGRSSLQGKRDKLDLELAGKAPPCIQGLEKKEISFFLVGSLL